TFYGSRYLLRPPAGVFERSPYLVQLTTTEAGLAWQLKGGLGPLTVQALAPDGRVRRLRVGQLARVRGRPAGRGGRPTAGAVGGRQRLPDRRPALPRPGDLPA